MHVKSIPHIRLRSLRRVRGGSQGSNTTRLTSASGFEFDTLRIYEQGDDVRRIDWNSSVRTGTLMVRSFHEQRNRSLLIMVDVSPSTYSGSSAELKCHAIQTIANSINLAAQSSRDTLSLCLTYNDSIIRYVPLGSGKIHNAYCISLLNYALDDLAQQHNRSHVQPPVTNNHSLLAALARHTWIILITDGLIKDYKAWWQQLSTRHALTVVRVRDRYEHKVPQFCRLHCYDPESATKQLYSLNSTSLQQQADTWYTQQAQYARTLGVPFLDIIAGNAYETAVRTFFEQGG